MDNCDWKNKKYSFFTHAECEAFPCHKGIDAADFNCLFCFCPLYALGDECGGSFEYLEDGTKDCSECTIPHDKNNYGIMIERIKKFRL